MELTYIPNKLVLDNVYCNGIHTLYRFEIKNLLPTQISVKLRSNLNNQIFWQLSNENIPNLKPNRLISNLSLDSNFFSASCTSFDYNSPEYPSTPIEGDIISNNLFLNHQFNQLFNQLGHIDEGNQSQQIIFAFLPSEKRQKDKTEDARDLSKEDSVFVSKEGHDETHDFFEINGLLFFFGYKIASSTDFTNIIPTELDLKKDIIPGSIVASHVASPPALLFSSIPKKSADGIVKISKEVQNQSSSDQAPPDFQTTVKFRSRVCRSMLWTDIGENGINFDDCVVGGTYYRDFTIWNKSEIDLYWLLNNVDLKNQNNGNILKFSEFETGEPLTFKPISAYSPLRVRVTFKPLEVGEINYDLQVENVNDSDNIVSSLVTATVRSVLKEECLVIGSGNLIDFGDCLTGVRTKNQILLKNISDSWIDISFGTDSPFVEFQLKLEVDNYPDHSLSTFHLKSGLSEQFSSKVSERVRNSIAEGSISALSSAASSDESLPCSTMETSITKDFDLLNGEVNELFANSSSSSIDIFDNFDVQNGDFVRSNNHGEELTRIEELQLRPGEEKTIDVCYRPEIELPGVDFRSGRLTKRTFRLFLTYSTKINEKKREKKTIQCKARVCTSLISVQPKELDFGDTDVGTLKSLPIKISNLSDLEAKFELRYFSKVLNANQDEISIPPKQSVEIKVDIYPRKVNPDYRKQINLINLLNRTNDQEICVRSTNFDKHRVTFHSLFYRILTPTSTNFLDFGSLVLDAPAVRTFMIDNISKKRLVLEVSSSLPEEIKLYIKAPKSNLAMDSKPDVAVDSSINRKERLIESFSDKRKVDSPTQSIISSANFHQRKSSESRETGGDVNAYLDLASNVSSADPKSPRRRQGTIKQSIVIDQLKAFATGDVFDILISNRRSLTTDQKRLKKVSDDHSKKVSSKNITSTALNALRLAMSKNNLALVDMIDNGGLSIDVLISMLEVMSGAHPPIFSKSSSEERFIRAQSILAKELKSMISSSNLIPASTIEVPSGEELMIVLVFIPLGSNKLSIQGKPKKLDAKIFVKLIEFDQDIENSQFSQMFNERDTIIPSRELLLRSNLCRSIMELGQKNINFGFMEKSEQRKKSIVIRNNSEAPLLYNIKKSGSISSGDIVIGEGRTGIIRAYAKREVEFSFEPTLPGHFHEKLIIENIQTPENDLMVNVKANIKKPSQFILQSLSIDFGICLLNDMSQIIEEIIISNPSEKLTKSFMLRLDTTTSNFPGCSAEITFELLESVDEEYFEEVLEEGSTDVSIVLQKKVRKRPMVLLSKDAEEQIELLEQKLKIAIRKGRKDKVVKLAKVLDKLKAGVKDDEFAKDESPKKKTANEVQKGEQLQLDVDVETETTLEPLPKSAVSTLSLTKLQPSQLKSKKLENAMMITLEPRQIRTVAVSFRAVEPKVSEFETDDDSITSRQLKIIGNIFVHEQKNTDVMKQVIFKAVVCLDHETYIQALENEQLAGNVVPFILDQSENGLEVSTSNRSSLVTPSTFRTIPPSLEATLASAEVFVDGKLQLVDALHTALPNPTFEVEHLVIELGRLVINESKDCYFKLSNVNDFRNEFRVVKKFEAGCTFKDFNVEIFEPLETRRVYSSFMPTVTGRGYCSFIVRCESSDDEIEVLFKWYGVLHAYLKFQHAELDLEYCFVNTGIKYAKVSSFSIQNISGCDIFVTGASNLALQCLLFADSLLESPFTDVFLAKDITLDVYIALQPYVNSGKVRNERGVSSSIQSTSIDSRVLIGGIKFVVSGNSEGKDVPPPILPESVNPSYFQLFMQTLKFTSVIGQSAMSISSSLIDFGTIKSTHVTLSTGFYVQNLSAKMPLEFTTTVTSGSFISIDKSSGSIPGNDLKLESQSMINRMLISVSVTPLSRGYQFGTVLVTNKNNSSQSFVIYVRLFVDDGNILVYGKYLSETLRSDGSSVTSLIWDDLYVSLKMSGDSLVDDKNFILANKNRASSSKINELSFEVENRCIEPMTLLPKSDMDVSVRWVLSSMTGQIIGGSCLLPLNNSFDQTIQCGPKISIYPNQKVTLFVSAPRPPSFSENDFSLLNSGSKVKSSGILYFEDETGSIRDIINLNCSYCLSKAVVEPFTIDIGKIGHSNCFKEVKFSFSIKNLSELPFVYNIDTPGAIEIVNDTSSNNQSKKIVESKSSIIVNGIVKPRLITEKTSGLVTFEITITNVFNTSNEIVVTLIGQLTLFELKFERLINGELILPPLTHPNLPSSQGSDTWFAVVNTSEEDVKFEISSFLAPGFIRMDILSRFSNTPLVGNISLAPHGTMEIRVRTYAKDIRIPLELKHLVSPEGLTFGNLSVSPKKLSNEIEESSLSEVVESIPVRGVFVDTPMFTVAEKMIEFKSLVDSDDENDEIKPPNGEKSNVINSLEVSKSVQHNFINITNRSTTLPLNFQVLMEFPIEFPNGVEVIRISSLDSENCGRVPPSSTLALKVELVENKIGGVSENMKIIITDKDSVSSHFHIVLLTIVEENFVDTFTPPNLSNNNVNVVGNNIFEEPISIPGSLWSGTSSEALCCEEESFRDDEDSNDFFSKSLSGFSSKSERAQSKVSTSSSIRRPTMVLRGCKRIADNVELFECDLGLQDLGTSNSRKLVLENSGNDRVSYSVKTISEFDKTWIIPSRYDGTFESLRSSGGASKEPQSILVSFLTSTRGIFDTYLVIENLDFPADSKFIRVYMEVVAKQNIRRTINQNHIVNASSVVSSNDATSNHVFDVFTNRTSNDVFDFSMDVFYNFQLSTRSFFVLNRESVPLEVFIKSNIPQDDPSEIVFSLSQSSTPALFKSLTLEPDMLVRVYIYFSPNSYSMPLKLLDLNPIEIKNFEVYVNCRLVKDYQKTVSIQACCYYPQMSISTEEIIFTGKFERSSLQQLEVGSNESKSSSSQGGVVLNFHYQYSDFSIKNLFEERLDIEVFNDCSYFILDLEENSFVDPSKTSRSSFSSSIDIGCEAIFRVKPNNEAITRNIELLRKEKYIAEHLTIYNRNRPSEKVFLTLKICAGVLSNFDMATSPKSNYSILEISVVRLLKDIEKK